MSYGERWDCGCLFKGEHGPDCTLALPKDESPWKTASRENWDADHGAGDFDMRVYQAALEDVFKIVQARRSRFLAGHAVALAAGIHPSNAEEIALDQAIARAESLRPTRLP